MVITGPSGSGKSSLAFDTVFAEAQRRYLESLSAYARQFVDQLKKPDVTSIRGLCPSIAIQQKSISKSPRSTAGTLTEVYDFMRLLFSRTGTPHCPNCKIPLSSMSAEDITRQILGMPVDTKINIMSLVVKSRKGEFSDELNELVTSGIARVRIDGEDISITKGLKLEKSKPHTIEAYIDRIAVKESSAQRIREAVELAASLFQGLIQVENLSERKILLFSRNLSCASCGFAFPELTPRLFSFNSPLGACSSCRGLGIILKEKNDDQDKEIEEEEIVDLQNICTECNGSRLKPEARSVTVGEKSIVDLHECSIEEAAVFFKNLRFSGNRAIIAEKILKEINDRLGFLDQVGLGYLSLSRRASTLSGGEEQRLHLATQIGTKLTGVLYILDEPSIGLHQADNSRLLSALQLLRDAGNSVIVIEHDEETILAADYVIDLGPGAGRLGGQVVEVGKPADLRSGPTADYLLGRKTIESPLQRRKDNSGSIKIRSASINNLQNIDVDFPIGLFTCVTGVSGSGKSSLVLDVLLQSAKHQQAVGCKKIEGLDLIDKIIAVDQSPIGRTPRSNPATYVGLFDFIRELFASTPVAKMRGYKTSRFSFNLKGGRCENCQGAGVMDLEMHFLADVTVTCEVCGGKRYNSETLAAVFKGRTIYDVLEMTFDEAFEFFEAIPHVQAKIKTLLDVGLGYIKLGQSAVTLSGGEAQRMKLSKELSKKSTGKTLYIFDEPTTGLHFVDVSRLLDVIQKLADLGNTVIVVEHHLDIIKSADHIIDLGPKGGIHGGKIIASGSPEAIMTNKMSETGAYLKALDQRTAALKMNTKIKA